MKHQEIIKRNFVTLEEILDAEGASRMLVIDAIIRNREKEFFETSKDYYRRGMVCKIPQYQYSLKIY